ncbi:MAG: tetratricopeptide repeat protein [Bacteroidales bacterium]|nr:tetratricopeptide repeat protein [Bacteroidales bacterium]
MKRTSILLALVALTIFGGLQAQTQSGVVKTRGRMVGDKLVPGTPLTGATVQVDGRQAMLSKDGKFSFPVKDGKYTLKSVTKQGYSLIDAEACRNYNYSKNPLTIVMESPEQQQQDKLTAERKIRRQLQDRLREKEDAIEALLEQNRITEEQYRKQLQELYSEQQNNEKLIADMAKQYSELDYDQLDEFQRQVSYCIENGQLAKADSLLRSQGDMNKQVEESLKAGAALQQQRDQLKKAEAVHAAKVEEMARRCYSFYEMFLLQHQNDSAAHYLELRASLDTTNVEWRLDAGEFWLNYFGNINKAWGFIHTASRHVRTQTHIKPSLVSQCYNDIGYLYMIKNDKQKALEYYKYALDNQLKHFGEDDVAIGLYYNNIALVYNYMNDTPNSKLYFKKAIDNWEKNSQEGSVAVGYSNLGQLYINEKDYDTGLKYLLQSISFFEKNDDETSKYYRINNYTNIAQAYFDLHEYDVSKDYVQKALKTAHEIFGESHTYIAKLLYMQGNLWSVDNQFDRALKEYEAASKMYKDIEGEQSTNALVAEKKIANVYFSTGDFEAAAKKGMMVLEALLKTLGENNKITADVYLFLANCYRDMSDFSNAMANAEKALDIYNKTIGPDHEETMTAKQTIEEIQKDKEKSGLRD